MDIKEQYFAPCNRYAKKISPEWQAEIDAHIAKHGITQLDADDNTGLVFSHYSRDAKKAIIAKSKRRKIKKISADNWQLSSCEKTAKRMRVILDKLQSGLVIGVTGDYTIFQQDIFRLRSAGLNIVRVKKTSDCYSKSYWCIDDFESSKGTITATSSRYNQDTAQEFANAFKSGKFIDDSDFKRTLSDMVLLRTVREAEKLAELDVYTVIQGTKRSGFVAISETRFDK